jgi:hypothetical protein
MNDFPETKVIALIGAFALLIVFLTQGAPL